MTDDLPGAAQVDAYLAAVASPQRETLEALRATLRRLLPHAEECLKYGMPTLALDGKGVAGYAAFKDHCGFYPMSGTVTDAAGDTVARYAKSKGGFRFGVDERLPVTVLRRLIALRLAEIAAVENGKRSEYYSDGRLKAVGPMKDGLLHGRWKWYREDGSLMRIGQFAKGEKTGAWTTYDRSGAVVKTEKLGA